MYDERNNTTGFLTYYETYFPEMIFAQRNRNPFTSVDLYWVTGQDVVQETEKWSEWTALATAADSVHSSVSCVTSCLVTQYIYVEYNFWTN